MCMCVCVCVTSHLTGVVCVRVISHLTGVGLISCFGTPTDSFGLSMLVSLDLAEEGGVPRERREVGVTSNAGLPVDGPLLLVVTTGLTLGCGRGTREGSSK